ncbi:MAG: hypothetical protein ACOC8C_01655 [Chloroflexota bacterium]
MQNPGFVSILPSVPVLLAHLVGVVIAVILLVKRRGGSTPAVLALAGFGLLLLLDGAGFLRGPLIASIAQRTAAGIRLAAAGVGCCCSVVDVTAMICLMAAVWKALSQVSVQGSSLGEDEDQGI